MADVYEMPTPKPPADKTLDALDERACAWLVRVDLPGAARKTIRDQRDAIRTLRVELAKTQANLTSTKAVAAAARDERVAWRCPGSWRAPLARYGDEPRSGLCPVCDQVVPFEAGGLCLAPHDVPAV